MNSHAAQVRQALPEDAESLLQVLCAAFQIDLDGARPLFYQDPFFDLSHKRVLVDPQVGLVSCLTVIPSSLRIGVAVIPTAGFAGVATHPNYQRQGYGGLLLANTLRALAGELTYPVAALFPYSYDFYRRFGWETASRAWHWTGPTSCLPAYKEAACVRMSGPTLAEDRAAIHQIHDAATRGRTGAFRRDPRRWEVIEALTPARQVAVFEERQGAVDGYAFFERRTGKDATTLVLHEMYARTAAARRGLVGFLAGRRMEAPLFEWETSPEDLHAFGLDGLPFLGGLRPQVTLKPGMMLRLLNLYAALALLHAERYAPVLAQTGGTLTIRATDPQCPQNERPVRVQPAGLCDGSPFDPDWIAAHIGVIAQLYIGFQTPSQAESLGLLSASSSKSLAMADRLFPLSSPYAAPADQF